MRCVTPTRLEPTLDEMLVAGSAAAELLGLLFTSEQRCATLQIIGLCVRCCRGGRHSQADGRAREGNGGQG